MRKRLLMVFALLAMLGVVLVGCQTTKPPVEEETFKLTLPSEVASNQADNTKVAKDATVVLTVTIPQGKEVKSFKIDGVETELVSGKTQFKMTKDITVTIEFKDVQDPDPEVFYKLTLPDEVTSNQPDNTKIKKDTDVVLTLTVPEGQELVSFKVDGVEKKAELVENKYTVKMTKDINVTVVLDEVSLAPSAVGELFHWMPGAIAESTGLVAVIDLKGVEVDDTTGDGLKVSINALPQLEYLVDYEIEGDQLKVFGKPLNNAELALGDHVLKLETVHGVGEMAFHVVDNPIETSIPTKVARGIDMSAVEEFAPTAPIANAPELLITELNFDRGAFDYIEVFNNTTEPYNLKGHRIVFSDLTKQILVPGVFHLALGNALDIYIDEDMIIPSLSKALLWVINGRPWNVAAVTGEPHRVSETADAKSFLLEAQGGVLSIDLFKSVYGIENEVAVFPMRVQYMRMRTDWQYSTENNYGLVMAKSDVWTSNTSTANRGVQIHKIDQETLFPVEGSHFAGKAGLPAGAAKYKYEFFVLNKEKDVYVDGEIDKTKITITGSGLGRESINALGARVVFYDSSDELIGYGTDLSVGVDLHGANGTTSYNQMSKDALKPVVTALMYADISGETASRWSEFVGLQYGLPDSESALPHGNKLMRYLLTQTDKSYADFYGEEDPLAPFKLAGISPNIVSEVGLKDVVVPVNPGYPLGYLNNSMHTAAETAWFNFHNTKPE